MRCALNAFGEHFQLKTARQRDDRLHDALILLVGELRTKSGRS